MARRHHCLPRDPCRNSGLSRPNQSKSLHFLCFCALSFHSSVWSPFSSLWKSCCAEVIFIPQVRPSGCDSATRAVSNRFCWAVWWPKFLWPPVSAPIQLTRGLFATFSCPFELVSVRFLWTVVTVFEFRVTYSWNTMGHTFRSVVNGNFFLSRQCSPDQNRQHAWLRILRKFTGDNYSFSLLKSNFFIKKLWLIRNPKIW